MVEAFSRRRSSRSAFSPPDQNRVDITLTRQQLSRIGYALMVVNIVLRGAFYFLQAEGIVERIFIELLIAGIALVSLPAFGYKRAAVWIALVMGWLSMVEMGIPTPSGMVYALSGYILVTMIAMITLQDRTWQLILVLSLVAISVTHVWHGQGEDATMLMNEVRSSWALQIAFMLMAAFIVSMVFNQFRKILLDTTVANQQLSEQRASLEQYSAELEQLNEKLSLSETRAATTMNVSPDTTLLINATGRIVGANDTACEKLGYNKEALLELNLTDIDPTVSEEKLKSVFERTFTGDYVLEQLSEHVTSRGQTIPVEVRSRYVMVDGEQIMYSIARDISQRLAMQEAQEEAARELKAQTDLLTIITENMPARVTYFDAFGKVIFSNRNAEHVGMQQYGILGCDKELRVLEGYDAIIQKHDQLAFAGHDGTYEIQRLDSKGNKLVEMVRYVPHYEADKLSGIFTLISDVTDARRTEEALQQAQKLESLGVLAGGIAHDFNNLLVGILGQSSIALARMDEAHASRKHILRSINAAERAASLTKQMLAYSGRGAFTVAPLNVNALVRQNLDLLTVSLPKSVKLTTSLSEGLPLIEADAAQMQQLIMNLLINAGQAIGEREGSIVVESGEEYVSAETDTFAKFTGKPLKPGNYTYIRIKDDGKGIEPDMVEHIFDPFYTTKEKGSGLGLAAVLGIIRGHNGGIKLSSTPGQGTEFHLLFPVLAQTDDSDAQIKLETHSMQQDELLVLVIDDEIDVLDVVADMLELEEIATLTSTRGAEGIEIFRANQDKISLVLLDLMMPGMNGEETFSALREIDPNIRVILSSGYSEAEATRRFVGNKLADFIQKPYDFQQLTDKVKTVLASAQMVTD